jgi:hypothetical protein
MAGKKIHVQMLLAMGGDAMLEELTLSDCNGSFTVTFYMVLIGLI